MHPSYCIPQTVGSSSGPHPAAVAQQQLDILRRIEECEARILQKVSYDECDAKISQKLAYEDYESRIQQQVQHQLKAFRTEITVRVDERVQDALRGIPEGGEKPQEVTGAVDPGALAAMEAKVEQREQRMEGREARLLAQMDREIEQKTAEMAKLANDAAQHALKNLQVPNPLDSSEMKAWMDNLNKERQETDAKLRYLALAVSPALEFMRSVPDPSGIDAQNGIGNKDDDKRRSIVLHEIREADKMVMQLATCSVNQAPNMMVESFRSAIKVDSHIFDHSRRSSGFDIFQQGNENPFDNTSPLASSQSMELPHIEEEKENGEGNEDAKQTEEELDALRKRQMQESEWAEREFRKHRSELKRETGILQRGVLNVQQELVGKLAENAQQQDLLKTTVDLLGREQSGVVSRISKLEASLGDLEDKSKKVEEELTKKRGLVTKRRQSSDDLDAVEKESKRVKKVGEQHMNEMNEIAEEWKNKVGALQNMKMSDILGEIGQGAQGILMAELWKKMDETSKKAETASEDRERMTYLMKSICQVLPKRRVRQLQDKLYETTDGI
jgi:hypothetical protein